jgi:hypothetical protein
MRAGFGRTLCWVDHFRPGFFGGVWGTARALAFPPPCWSRICGACIQVLLSRHLTNYQRSC